MKTSSLPKPLSDEETEKKFRLMKLGDTQARNDLINHNIRLVAEMVYRRYYENDYIELDDLYSSLLIHLIKAVEKYDVDRGVKFSTCLYKYLETGLKNEFSNAKELKPFQTQSLDDYTTDDENHTIEEIIPSDVNVMEEAISKVNMEYLASALECLTKVEKQVIYYRYMYKNRLTQLEVSEILNCTRANVSQMERRALRKMRVYLIQNNLVDAKEYTRRRAR